MKFLKSLTIVLFSTGILMTACTTNEEVNPGVAPELPPVASMTIDFSYFDGTNIGGRTNAASNWERAASVVGFWSTVLTANLTLPVAAFKVAINEKPAYDRDRGLWVWSYTYDFVGKKYTSELTGQLQGNEVVWKMYISEQGGFQNALWYSGVMKADGTSGYWLLNYNGNNPTEYLRIDWAKEGEDIGTIKFTYTLDGSAEYGSYIEYSHSSETDFDRTYKVYLSAYEANVTIEWNAETSNGHIMDSYYFQDVDYHCWDSDFMDVDC
ncbi:MAG: hypothetical protein KDC79_06115 [Cyclobacteriaceae bacterium]|nr:hypothetical protein [Cyclobacteriaceae bacterium]